MHLLFDLDIFLYRGLFACQDQYYPGLRACDYLVNRVFDRFDTNNYTLILSGSNNFRKEIDPAYKANRKPESKPKYLYDARQYFIKYYNTVVAEGQEADDMIGMMCDQGSIIISSDKDYKQLGYPIYNPFKDEYYEIDNPRYHFWMQCLTGDAADNIKTLPGIGPKKAEKILADKSEIEMKEAVIEKYKEVYGDGWYAKFDTILRLLFLRRKDHQEYLSWV